MALFYNNLAISVMKIIGLFNHVDFQFHYEISHISLHYTSIHIQIYTAYVCFIAVHGTCTLPGDCNCNANWGGNQCSVGMLRVS